MRLLPPVPRPLAAIGRQMGRRGAFLTFLVILDASIGYSFLVTPGTEQLRNLWLPYHVWAWIWIFGAVNAALGVFRKKDWPHFVIAAMLKVAWGSVEASVWLNQHVPRGWVTVIIWLGFAATVLIIDGWPEPNPISVVHIEPPDGKD